MLLGVYFDGMLGLGMARTVAVGMRRIFGFQ